MKLKRLTLNEREYRLAPLTLDQVESLYDESLPAKERTWNAIADSLRNAGGDPSSLKHNLDYEDYSTLHEEVLAISGLKRQPPLTVFDPEDRQAKNEPVDFLYLRARLAAHCGWTFAECDQSPFPYVMRLLEYWAEESPPVDPMFASFVGFKPSRRMRDYSGAQDSTREEKAALVSQWGGRIIRGADNLPTFMQAALEKEGLLHFPGTPVPTLQQ